LRLLYRASYYPTTNWTTTDTILVKIYGDIAFEPNEFFKLVLKNPVNIALADSEATCQIKNDDGAVSAVNQSFSNTNSKIIVPTLLSRKQVWQIQGVDNSKAAVTLFSETGVKVFYQSNYKNNAVLDNLSPGIYFYKLIVKDQHSSVMAKEYRGKIVLTE